MLKPQYTLEDLILDKDFIQWVKDKEPSEASTWLAWSQVSPENANLIQEAREIILGLTEDIDNPEQHELDSLWNRISASNDSFDAQRKHLGRIRSFQIKKWLQVAAIFIGFVFAGAISYYALNRDVKHFTKSAHNKRIQLPDGSVVVLNSNSLIHYPKNWKDDEAREVWLEGEGFFSVTHKLNSQKFIVHTKDLDVQVLGTTFNVNTRRGKTHVVLKSGKVNIILPQNQGKGGTIMKPGELVSFSKSERTIEKKEVQIEKYTAWLENKLTFENTRLAEMAAILKDNYGFNVTFENPELKELTFTGTVESDNTDLLFKILQRTFKISITKKEDNIIIATQKIK